MKPSKAGKVDIQEYNQPTGGWGSAQSLIRNAAGQGLAFSDVWATLRGRTRPTYTCATVFTVNPLPERGLERFKNSPRIRSTCCLEHCYPDDFRGFNERFRQPGGFDRDIGASKRVWNTVSGKANIIAPPILESDGDINVAGGNSLTQITIGSNDQLNTTIYGYRNRLRGIYGTRMVLLMNEEDIVRLGLQEGQEVALESNADDGVPRRVEGPRVTSFAAPRGNCAGYYPEFNPLVPLWHHEKKAHVPVAKSVPVRIAG